MRNKYIKTVLLTGVLCVTLSSVVGAKSVITLSEPNTGIKVDKSIENDKVLVEALITEGISDITVSDNNIDEITEAYKDLTKLPITEEQEKVAKKEYELAKDLVKNNKEIDVAQFLAENKLTALQNKDKVEYLKSKYNVEMTEQQKNELRDILKDFIDFRYNSVEMSNLLNKQLQKEDTVLSIIKKIMSIV